MFYRIARNIKPLSVCRGVNNLNRGYCTKRHLPIRSGWSTDPWEGFFRDPHWRRWSSMDKQLWKMMENMMRPWGRDSYYFRPWGTLSEDARSEVAKVKYDDKTFEVKIDVQNFTPAELDVKVAGNRLTVSGKHEKKSDEHGFISREFQREFAIPEDVNLETITSTLTEDGFLTIKANVIEPEKPPEKTIDINVEKQTPKE